MFAKNADESDAARKPSDATESADVTSLADSMNVQQKAIFAAMLLSPMPDHSYRGLIMFRPLNDENVRKELKLSSEQDKQLRELSAVLWTQMQKWELLTKEQFAQQQPERVEEVKTAFKQVKELLTTEQATIFKRAVLHQRLIILCHRSEDPQRSEMLGLNDEQKKQFARLFKEMVMLRQPLRETTEKSLAVLSPEQRERLPKVGYYNPTPEIWMTRIAETANEKAEGERRMEESNKKGVLTPQPLQAYKKISFDKLTLPMLANPQFLERANVNLTEEQQKELRRLRENLNEKMGQFSRELGEKCWTVLTPQQRDKFVEDVDRWWAQV